MYIYIYIYIYIHIGVNLIVVSFPLLFRWVAVQCAVRHGVETELTFHNQQYFLSTHHFPVCNLESTKIHTVPLFLFPFD